MRILVVTPYYLPDGGPSAPLYAMLCEQLVRRGHGVTVVAAVPHYPSGHVLPSYRQRRFSRETQNGVHILRVPVPSLDRSRLPLRLLQFLSFQLGATWAGWQCEYDVLLAGNPALHMGLPFICLGPWRHKPAVLAVADVYPDAGVDLGIFRHKLVIAAVAGLERFCLKRADSVRIISESFATPLEKLGVPRPKLALITDWVDCDLIRPLPRANAFSQEHGLDDKYVVLYAGNIGLSQGLEHVLAAAGLLAVQDEIQFVIVGDGASLQRLRARTEQAGLSNVTFLPFQPRERLPEVLASADVSLVSLQRGAALRSLPSKILSILASGRPLVASRHEGSDSWKLIQRAQAGLCVPAESPALLAEAILVLKQDVAQAKEMGRNGRDYALRYHSPEAGASKFEELFHAVLSQAAAPRKGCKEKSASLGIKRGFDVVFALTLLVVLAPLLLLVALAVRLTSPGPVLFRHERLGRNGIPFVCYKFRSMVQGAGALAPRDACGATIVGADDPRVTPVGRVLRQWSLDELPQLWNILRGEMSVVGPRPDEVLALDLYTARQRLKLEMRPGLTGLATINGRNSISWPERLEWDASYVESFSLKLDLIILWRTAGVVLRREGIYTSADGSGRG
jgi:colanic acid biosynthesis glycosyl transferase WcaI